MNQSPGLPGVLVSMGQPPLSQGNGKEFGLLCELPGGRGSQCSGFRGGKGARPLHGVNGFQIKLRDALDKSLHLTLMVIAGLMAPEIGRAGKGQQAVVKTWLAPAPVFVTDDLLLGVVGRFVHRAHNRLKCRLFARVDLDFCQESAHFIVAPGS